jgi:hypothetical protein
VEGPFENIPIKREKIKKKKKRWKDFLERFGRGTN